VAYSSKEGEDSGGLLDVGDVMYNPYAVCLLLVKKPVARLHRGLRSVTQDLLIFCGSSSLEGGLAGSLIGFQPPHEPASGDSIDSHNWRRRCVFIRRYTRSSLLLLFNSQVNALNKAGVNCSDDPFV
jgi:hypothetical protein